MTTVSRFEHELARVLDDLVEPPGPDEISAVLARTAVIRQRPSWTYPERWIPFAEVTARITAARRVPVRLLALLVLLVLLTAGALLFAGSSPPRPRPFGPATNGLVIFSAAGDIFTADPVTGVTRRVVGGAGWDVEPRWSRDGSHFLFMRAENGEGITGRRTLYVARADGRDLRPITEESVFTIGDPMFSPDGTSVLFVATGGLVSIASADGRRPLQVLDLPFSVQEAAFRPPDGSSISLLYAEQEMYLVNSDGTDLRPLVLSDRGYWIGQPTWSPNGSVMAYIRWLDTGSITARIVLVSPESGEVRALPVGPGSTWEGEPSWSNDGTRLAVARGYAPDNSNVRAAVVPVPAGGLGVETDPSLDVLGSCCLAGPFEWAPDDSAILFTPTDATGPIQQTLIDPATGVGHPATWRTTSGPSWQRRP
jgi:Tol biopolymer transport system component